MNWAEAFFGSVCVITFGVMVVQLAEILSGNHDCDCDENAAREGE